MLYADTLSGPWSRVNLSGFGQGWDWTRLNLGLESHGPTWCSDGSILTFTRAHAAPAPAPLDSIWLVRADGWNGTYAAVGGTESVFSAQTDGLEDSFMFQVDLLHPLSTLAKHLFQLERGDGLSRPTASVSAASQDPRGNLHALFHAITRPAVGSHAFSPDGKSWTMSPTPAYWTETFVGDVNTTFSYHRRERPQ